MTEPIDIAARRELLDAASPRPWESGEATRYVFDTNGSIVADFLMTDNNRLIVAAVNDYGTLLETLAEIRARVDQIAGRHESDYERARVLASIDLILRRTIR